MSRWFRHYAGMCRDEKLVRVALRAKQPIERVVWVYAAILESAAEVNEDGRYDFDIGEASYFLRSDEDDVRRIVDALEDMERLCEGSVAKWGDRQFKSDTSADRQRNYRDRKKQAHGDNGDGVVTSPSRHGDAPELETDTEIEKKEDSPKRVRTSYPEDFEKFWDACSAWRGHSGKKEAADEWRKLSSEDREAAMSGVAGYSASLRVPNAPTPLHVCRFLKYRRFEVYAGSVVPFAGTGPPKEEYSEAEKARRLKEWRERGFYEATK